MERVEHSIKEEPECKKAKMVNNGHNALGNDLEPPTFLKKDRAVDDADGASGVVPSMDNKERKDISVSFIDGDYSEVLLLAVEESQDVSVGSDESKVRGVSMSRTEERKGDAGKREVPVLLEEEKDVSSLPVNANVKEIPTTESEEEKDSCIVATILKGESSLRSLAIGSSASFPRKKLLVLDLNGLLADIIFPPPKDYVADIYIARKAIFKRAFFDDFLRFCFEKFKVGIWSSRTQRNVDSITNALLGDLKSKLLFCWDMSHCALTTVGSLENKHKYVVFKELKRLWEKHDPDLPWQKGDYNETNTVLLDDSPYKALLNPPHTAIFPHTYHYQSRTDNSLGERGDLRRYLKKLAESDNVQEFIKMNPFGQDPITDKSESWEFYSEILGKMQL